MSKDKRRSVKAEPAPPAAPQRLNNNPFLAHKGQLQGLIKPPPAKDPAPKGKPTPSPKVAPPVLPPPTPQVSDEDLFLREMWGVRRTQDAAPRVEGAPIEPKVRMRLSEEAEVYAELADLIDGTGPFDLADTDEYIEGIAPGLDRRLLTRLRKGEYAIQAHLDLHGMTSEEAHHKVDRFVQESRLQGRRCILIIHGRGINSKDQIPILKERLRVWLTRGRIARSVLCFTTARPADGGAGAVYVLLRK